MAHSIHAMSAAFAHASFRIRWASRRKRKGITKPSGGMPSLISLRSCDDFPRPHSPRQKPRPRLKSRFRAGGLFHPVSQGQTRRSAPCRKCVRILLFPARWWPFEISCHRKGSGGDSGMVNSQGVSGWAGFGTDYARPGGDYSHLYRLQGGWLFRRAAWMAGSFDRNLTGDKNLAKAATGT